MKAHIVSTLNIIAIGGGGFTHNSHPSLDEICLQQTGKHQPKVGFIGAASQDDPIKIERFHTRFLGIAAACIHLPMDTEAQILPAHLEGLDLVYVGGGNTEALMKEWRRLGWDHALIEAAHNGLTLAGVSAGAVCWFEHFLFSSGTGPMRVLPGLGLLKGGACPHYSTEPERKPILHASVAERTMPDSIAIDDGVAVVFGPNGPVSTHSAEPNAGAHRVTRNSDGTTTETPLTC